MATVSFDFAWERLARLIVHHFCKQMYSICSMLVPSAYPYLMILQTTLSISHYQRYL